MMDRCGARGCQNEATGRGGYSFFPVPTDPELRDSWEFHLEQSDLPQSTVICEKHFSSEEVITDENGEKTLKPNAVPSLKVKTIEEEGSSPVRRSSRKRVPKKVESSKGNDSQSGKKKGTRLLFKTTAKSPEKNKRTRASKNEKENSDLQQDLTVKRSRKRRKNKESCDVPSKTSKKVELIGDDKRGHAIAEWYLLDIFEATRVITSVLHTGTLVTDCLVANMEETIIEIISKLLQRLSSVLITTLEKEFDIKCNILPVLRNLHENIKENVNELVTEENDNSAIQFKPDEDSYEQALRCLDSKDPPSVVEEVISSPFDEDFMLIEHSYCRPSEQEAEKTKKRTKGGEHSIKQKFQCGFCTFKTFYKSKLRRHVKHHLHYKKRFECDMCDYCATTTEAYSKHVRTHTGEKPYGCDLCDFRTANRSNLNRHRIIHEDVKPFACPHCDHSTRQRGSLIHHIECAHNNTDRPKVKGRQSVYACGDCSFITISRQEFIAHGKTHKNYNCSQCDFVGKDSKELKTHQATHKVEDRLLSCDLCNYSTFRSAYLRRHVATHSMGKPFKCEVCLNTYRSQAHLNMHARKHEIGPTARGLPCDGVLRLLCTLLHKYTVRQSLEIEICTQPRNWNMFAKLSRSCSTTSVG
uniref:Transcriptional repressor CTCF n=1 Tax=Lygus hesperus TaxID=30085 RepID=A0A0K8T3S4_LYGHE